MKSTYIFFTDFDYSHCITEKKNRIKATLKHIDENSIIVVVAEIESWFLAGFDENKIKKLNIKPYQNTDSITKEQFNKLIPRKINSRIIFIEEILESFSCNLAMTKNISFKYFMGKYKSKLF